MNYEEFQKEYEKRYHFFFSEFKKIKESDLAHIIELMRASQHIKDIQKLMILMNPEGLEEDDEMQYWINNDSLITMILNISAAQLREALKIFWKLSETDFFKSIKNELSSEEIKIIDPLIKLNEEFGQNKGFIYEVLLPVRNLIFHYQSDKDIHNVVDWVKETKQMECERKPHNQSINLEKFEF